MAESKHTPTEFWSPTVSVIVATYNRPALLRRALISVAAQSFKDFECFVVHDGQEEEGVKATSEVMVEVSPLFEAIGVPLHFLATETHMGYYTHPRNYATYHTSGDYIANLDDDNEWTPDHLSGLVATIEEGEEWPDFTYSRREYVVEEGAPKEVGGQAIPSGPSPLVPWNGVAVARINAGPSVNFIDSGDFLIAKGALYNLGVESGHIWNEGIRRYGDWELIWRGLRFAGWRGKAVDQVTHRYHWHGTNIQLTRPPIETYQEVQA